MFSIQRAARGGMAIISIAAMSACGSNGGLGNILGGVLGGQGQGQGQGEVSGTVENINTRNQQVSVRMSNGQNVTLDFDNQTQVVYQNQNYSVNNLEYGDRVTARIINSNNNRYYTDLIQVDQSVSRNGNVNGQENVQRFEGTVRDIDRSNGVFILSGSRNGSMTVSLPYNARRADIDKFNQLRSGDYVRLYGVLLNDNRVELRNF